MLVPSKIEPVKNNKEMLQYLDHFIYMCKGVKTPLRNCLVAKIQEFLVEAGLDGDSHNFVDIAKYLIETLVDLGLKGMSPMIKVRDRYGTISNKNNIPLILVSIRYGTDNYKEINYA